MKHDQDLTAEESLDIITRMIEQAKGNIMNNSIYFILWGIVIIIANLGMFVLIIGEYKYPYVAWSIALPAWIFTIYHSWTQSKQSSTTTHLDRVSAALWISFGVVVFTLIPFGRMINFQLNPAILLFSALPTLVSGISIRFKPLIVGGVTFWILGIVCFLVHGPWQFLIGAIAVLIGFLIPGIMLRNKRPSYNV